MSFSVASVEFRLKNYLGLDRHSCTLPDSGTAIVIKQININRQSTKRILNGSIPTLNIPGFHEDPTSENCFYFPAKSTEVTTEAVPSPISAETEMLAVPGTSKDISPEVKLLRTTPSKKKFMGKLQEGS
ncbi:hypothetical protein Zmor_014410 [Zophobas morio]|uniref:Uncharacterized protein n=1 Tax=Zophobas morio TaxID=2755281 RepID=A0AA38IKP5_9CUCU|nr:hypothetical protein Zmor_014410 [Zophobas morio]